MAIESKPLIMGARLAWAVVAATVLFSQKTLAEPASTVDHGQLRSETRSAAIAAGPRIVRIIATFRLRKGSLWPGRVTSGPLSSSARKRSTPDAGKWDELGLGP